VITAGGKARRTNVVVSSSHQWLIYHKRSLTKAMMNLAFIWYSSIAGSEPSRQVVCSAVLAWSLM